MFVVFHKNKVTFLFELASCASVMFFLFNNAMLNFTENNSEEQPNSICSLTFDIMN